MLPQILIAGFIRRLGVRKWVWVAGSAAQALCVAGMGLVALSLEGSLAGWSLIVLLAVFSLARGLCSVASKDILGKTIPKSRRGRLKGWMSSASGFIAMGFGAFLIGEAWTGSSESSVGIYALLLFVAAFLWAVAAGVYSRLKEFSGETEGGGNAISEALDQIRLLKTDENFRRFVGVRALAIGSGMGAPFVISLAHQSLGGSALWLGIFVMVDGFAALLSAPALGRWADRSSRNLLRASMLIIGALLLGVSVLPFLALPEPALAVLFPLIFFLLGIGHSGVRLGRKTYLVDFAEGNRRTAYVAVSNTVIGVLLLFSGALTGLVALLSVPAVLVLFSLAAVLGAWGARKLPEVSEG
ncbi:MFS transporter [Puniceicoccus vermicola]|uniref:MFS transporter n=1 Tax=Puniceicoccus vermicola TaxID=388746 RepID=UPI001C8B103D|nr:MFS transporter [Puniceicoccus vermicola]